MIEKQDSTYSLFGLPVNGVDAPPADPAANQGAGQAEPVQTEHRVSSHTPVPDAQPVEWIGLLAGGLSDLAPNDQSLFLLNLGKRIAEAERQVAREFDEMISTASRSHFTRALTRNSLSCLRDNREDPSRTSDAISQLVARRLRLIGIANRLIRSASTKKSDLSAELQAAVLKEKNGLAMVMIDLLAERTDWPDRTIEDLFGRGLLGLRLALALIMPNPATLATADAVMKTKVTGAIARGVIEAVLAAHIECNGEYQPRGLASLIEFAYQQHASQFTSAVQRLSEDEIDDGEATSPPPARQTLGRIDAPVANVRQPPAYGEVPDDLFAAGAAPAYRPRATLPPPANRTPPPIAAERRPARRQEPGHQPPSVTPPGPAINLGTDAFGLGVRLAPPAGPRADAPPAHRPQSAGRPADGRPAANTNPQTKPRPLTGFGF